MKTQRLLFALTIVNFAILFVSLFRWNNVEARSDAPILRGRALEIVDDAGRVRASLSVLPADPNVRMPDGSTGYPETVLLRMINSQGRPNIKIAATERGAGVLVAGESDPTYVQILADGTKTSLRLTDSGGVQLIKP